MNRSRALFVLSCIALVTLVADSPVSAANRKGGKAAEIEITDGINGVTAKTKLADYKGSPTLLVVWVPVCPHCRRIMPNVHNMHKKYGPKGLKVLTITHGKKYWVQKYLTDRGWSFGVGFDWRGTTARRYGMKRMPGIYLVGADGTRRFWRGTLEQAIVDELNAQ